MLTDVDQDGNLDILHGLSRGRLDYYQNQGTNLSPSFVLDTEAYLGIVGGAESTNISLAVGFLTQTEQQDLITTDRSGVMKIYRSNKLLRRPSGLCNRLRARFI